MNPIKCSRLSSDGSRIAAAIMVAATTVMLCACAKDRGARGGQPPLEPLQRAPMQTREMQGDFDTAYAATLSVLQDHGWQLDTIDKASGIIQASSLKRQDLLGPQDDWRREDPDAFEDWKQQVMGDEETEPLPEWTRWEQITAHIEAWGAGSVRERVSIVLCGGRPSSERTVTESRMFGLRKQERTVVEPAVEQSVLVDSPDVYQRLFEEIQRALFIRRGLTGVSR